MRHLSTGRLVVYGATMHNSQFAPQKAQEQENQLRNQLKQNYMQIVSSSHCISSLPSTEPYVPVQLPKADEELEAEKKTLTTKQQAAIDTAIAAIKTENPPAVGPMNEEAEKKHNEKLKALEEHLHAEHRKKELEAAGMKMILEGTTEKSAGADIETTLAAAKAEWEKAHEEEIEKVIERGRVEQQTTQEQRGPCHCPMLLSSEKPSPIDPCTCSAGVIQNSSPTR